MRIFAIDPSLTSTGWASGPATSGILVPPKDRDRGVLRLTWIRDELFRLIRSVQADLVAIEGYSFGSSNGRVVERAELGGVLRVALHESGFTWVDVPPATVKKFATGNGNANKDVMLTDAVRRLMYHGSSKDEADALWLWHCTAHAYGLRSAVKVPLTHIGPKPPQWPKVTADV